MNLSKSVIACVLAAFLAACGGGGGSGGDVGGTQNPPSQPAGIDIAAAGIYKATVKGGPLPIFQSLVVGPTGKGAIYYEDAFGGSRGFVDATLSGSSGNFTASLTDFAKTGIFNGKATGTYRGGSGLDATVTYPGQTATIQFTFDGYPTSPDGPKSAVGSWNSMDERGTTQAITIAGTRTATFTIAYGAQCTVTGTAAFGDNGTNILQLASISGTASGGGCRFGDGPMTGLLLVKSPGTPNPSIIGHLVRQDQKDGFMLQSFRCRDGSSRTSLPLFGC